MSAFWSPDDDAVAFDTHAFVERLTAVGMPEAQADALADEYARLIDERLAALATRGLSQSRSGDRHEYRQTRSLDKRGNSHTRSRHSG